MEVKIYHEGILLTWDGESVFCPQSICAFILSILSTYDLCLLAKDESLSISPSAIVFPQLSWIFGVLR